MTGLATWQSLQVLAAAFSAKVFHGRPLLAGEYAGTIPWTCFERKQDGSLQTNFFLDPSEESYCGGSDWVGKRILQLFIRRVVLEPL